MSGAYRVPADPPATSSSPGNSGPDWSSPPSSPTFARAASHASADPFSGSAKSLKQPRRGFGRAKTTPVGAVDDANLAGLTLVPGDDEPEGAEVLGQFFESEEEAVPSSDDTMSSSVESVSLVPQTRTFTRTDSASTDPLSGLGVPRVPEPQAQRMRMVGTSPKKLTRAKTSAVPLHAWEQPAPVPAMRPHSSVHWPTLINKIFDEGREAPALLLGGCHLEQIPTLIGDLHSYVAIAPRRSDPRARIESARERARNVLQCYLWDNRLTRLPSALFQLRNLGVLSLRKNALTHLPPAIGELHALRELNVGGNALQYLPAEIQRLELDTFTYVPNPFLPLPAHAPISQRARHSRRTVMGPPPVPRVFQRAQTDSHARWHKQDDPVVRVLGPLERRAIPTLAELCMRRLLSTECREEMLLEHYETGCLRALQYTLDVRVVAQLEAARRSAAQLWGTPTNAMHTSRHMRQRLWYDHAMASPARDAPEQHAVDVDQILEEEEDACDNAYFNRCPNAHESTPATDGVSDWPVAESAMPHAPLFVRPCEQRMEWVSHVAGVRVAKQGTELLAAASDAHAQMQHSGCLPLLWRGCSPGCLAFLEKNL